MKTRRASLWLGPVFAVLTLGATAAPERDRGLIIETQTAEEIAGSFVHGSSLVSFVSRRAGPDRVVLRVDANALTFDASVDVSGKVARMDGHNGIMLAEDRAALAALFESLRPLGAGSVDARAHEVFLYRWIAYWAEAPVGTTLAAREVRPPRVSFESSRPGGVNACQVADDNGIRYFNCNRSPQVECHDAGHCFTCASRAAGRNSNDCAGECGPGCNGLNIYTWDCLDHDYCCRIHGGCWNPWDGECGDEWWDADDDFIWGWPNC